MTTVPGLIDVLAEEMHGEGIGQASLLDRLLDGLTVTAIRHWASSSSADPPGWLRAGTDPIVGAALDLMHDQTAQPWTLASLAERVGMSRAGFSRRFVAAVGEPPMTYLTSWRLAHAADRLRQDDVPVSSVAAEVGYTSPFTSAPPSSAITASAHSPTGTTRRTRVSVAYADFSDHQAVNGGRGGASEQRRRRSPGPAPRA